MKDFALTVSTEAEKGFYPTPPDVADKLLDGVNWYMVRDVLEPSAGSGNLVRSALKKYRIHGRRSYNDSKIDVDCVEIDPHLRAVLQYEFCGGRADELKEQHGINAVRPLAANTMRRVIRGVDKFTIKSGKPFIVECNHSGAGHIADIESPHGTITAKNTSGLCKPLIAPVTFSNTNGSVGFPASKPVHTVTTDGKQILASAQLIQYHTEQKESVRASGVTDPLPTLDTSNRYGLTTAHLVEYFSTGRPLDVREPMHTITTREREALTAVHISKYFSGVDGANADAPLPTVTAIDHNSLCAAHIAEFKGQDKGQHSAQPLRTITAGDGQFGVCQTVLAKAGNGNYGHWAEIRTLLNQHCGYSLADDDIILLRIGGTFYYIHDILLRMLTPRELYAAMGFPPDYIIDHDYRGNEYGRGKQVARCGNAVCPPLAEAVVRANYSSYYVQITTMRQLAQITCA